MTFTHKPIYRLIAASLLAQGAIAEDQMIVEETITTASPIHTNPHNIIQGVSILSGDELLKKSASTIGETLNNEIGVASSSFGPSVGVPVIRGQSAVRVKVLQDGLGTLDVSSASPDHAITTEPLLAEQIEVLRGPATLRYGNGAIGGVVNVIDNRIPTTVPEELSGGVEVRHNTVNDGDNLVFKLDGGSGQFAWHLDGLYRSTNNLDIDGPARHEHEEDHDDDHDDDDHHEEEETTIGFIDNTDSRTKSVTGGFSWVGDDGFVGFSVSRLESNYGIPPGGHEHAHEDDDDDHDDDEDHEEEEEVIRLDLEQTRYDIKGELNNPLAGFEKLSFRLGYNDYEHVEQEGGTAGTVFSNEGWESRLELIHNPWGEWKGAIGLQLTDREFAAIGDEAFIPAADITNYGAFIIEDLDLGEWHYELGLRVEHQEVDLIDVSASESHTSVSGSAGVQWHFTDVEHLSFNFSHADRAPTVEELFSFGEHLATSQFIIGDSNLDNETSNNFELGYHYHGDIKFQLFFFYNDITDFIYERNTGVEDPDSELLIFEYEQEDATFKGVESELIIPLNDNFSLTLFGDYVRAELSDGGDVPRVTPMRFGTELGFNQDNWQASLRWTEVDDQDRPGDLEEETEGYSRLDANLSYQMACDNANYTFFVRGNNLLNEEIRNATSFLREVAPEAGRGVQMGVRLTF